MANIIERWDLIKLENLLDFYIGGDWGDQEPINSNYTATKVLRATDISNWENDHGENAQVRFLKDNSLAKRQLKENDLIIEVSGGSPDQPVGRTIIISSDDIQKFQYPITCSNFFRLLRFNNKINPKFINYYFKFLYETKIIESYQSNSTNLRNLKFNQFINQNIPVPQTLGEQQEIVDVLDAASAIIRLRTACIESAQSLIPALFQEMFGDMSKNTNSYELFKIKNLGKVTTGSTPSSKKENMFGGDIPFITPADLESGQDKYGRYVTQEGAKNSRIVRAGSTLVCCIGATIGKVDKAIVDSCFNQQINAIEWDESINDIFGLYLFRQIAPLIRNKASHTTLPILNKGNFENIIIPKPPKPKQDLFAEKAQEIEAYIKTQQAELENAKIMFQSLLHHSFTGELTRHKFGGDTNG